MDGCEMISIEDLLQDDHNFNKGNDDGYELIVKSFKEFGTGRSVLIDKDNRLIAGNSSARAAIQSGIRKVRVIETTGDELVAVRRTDMSLDSQKGRGMALAHNTTGQLNLTWDCVQLRSACDELNLNMSDWGFDTCALDANDVDLLRFFSPNKKNYKRRTYIVRIRVPRKRYGDIDEIVHKLRDALIGYKGVKVTI